VIFEVGKNEDRSTQPRFPPSKIAGVLMVLSGELLDWWQKVPGEHA